jgi:hypothetical protein
MPEPNKTSPSMAFVPPSAESEPLGEDFKRREPQASVARSAPQLSEVRRVLDRYRPKDAPRSRRAGRPPVLNPSERRRGD